LLAGSFHKINLVIIIQDDEYVVMRVIVKLRYDFLFVLDVIFRENESITILKAVFIIFELINQLITCEKGDHFTFLAKSTYHDRVETLKIDCIHQVEIIIFVVTNLIYTGFVDDYHRAETSIIKTVENFLDIYFFAIIFIFTLE